MNTKRGFMLVEAILATALIGSSVLVRAELEKKQVIVDSAKEAGTELVAILQAFDDRVVYDGYIDKSGGSWNAQWNNTSSVYSMLKSELIGYKNSECSGGWHPEFSQNDSLALLPCSFTDIKNPPLEFELTAKRKDHATYHDDEGKVLGEWEIIAYHPNNHLFEKYFGYYGWIIQEARFRSGLSMAGLLQIDLVNRNTGSLITPSQCSSLKSSACGIRFKYSNLIHKQIYLRVDGSKPMEGGLAFRIDKDSEKLKCHHIKDGNKIVTPCGLNFDEDGKVFGSLDTLTANSLIIQDSAKKPTTTAPILCKDRDSNIEKLCGITMVKKGGSALINSYIDNLHTANVYADFIRTKELSTNKSSTYDLEVDNVANIKTANIDNAAINEAHVSKVFSTYIQSKSISADTASASTSITTPALKVERLTPLNTKPANLDKIFIDADLSVAKGLSVQNGIKTSDISISATAKEENLCHSSSLGKIRRLPAPKAGLVTCEYYDNGSGLAYRWKPVGMGGVEVGKTNVDITGAQTAYFPASFRNAKLIVNNGYLHVLTSNKPITFKTYASGSFGYAHCAKNYSKPCNGKISSEYVQGCTWTGKVDVAYYSGSSCNYYQKTVTLKSHIKGDFVYIK